MDGYYYPTKLYPQHLSPPSSALSFIQLMRSHLAMDIILFLLGVYAYDFDTYQEHYRVDHGREDGSLRR